MNNNKSNAQDCACTSSTALVIERKRVSRYVAVSLLGLFGIFTAGYFLGKKKGSELLALKIEQEAFADQMNVALHTLYSSGSGSNSADNEQEEDESVEQPSVAQGQPEYQEPETQGSSKHYQALLMGGTSKDVHAFANRLTKRGITVEVKARQGKSRKGNPITWYQAITPEFSNKEEFDKLIVAIKKTEKINEKILELG